MIKGMQLNIVEKRMEFGWFGFRVSESIDKDLNELQFYEYCFKLESKLIFILILILVLSLVQSLQGFFF